MGGNFPTEMKLFYILKSKKSVTLRPPSYLWKIDALLHLFFLSSWFFSWNPAPFCISYTMIIIKCFKFLHVDFILGLYYNCTASTKPEYPVIDRNPPFTKVVGNFGTLDYLRFVTITGVSVTVGYLSGINSFFLFLFLPPILFHFSSGNVFFLCLRFRD